MRTALVAIGRMENRYAREWVEHHHEVGFNHIYILDNNRTGEEHFEDVLQDYIDIGYVTVWNFRDKVGKQKFVKDKMATEGHLGTLCNLIWSKTPQVGSFNDLFALGIISSMFGWGSPFSQTTSGTDFLKKELESSENVEKQ